MSAQFTKMTDALGEAETAIIRAREAAARMPDGESVEARLDQLRIVDKAMIDVRTAIIRAQGMGLAINVRDIEPVLMRQPKAAAR